MTPDEPLAVVERIMDKLIQLGWFGLVVWLCKMILDAVTAVLPYVDNR